MYWLPTDTGARSGSGGTIMTTPRDEWSEPRMLLGHDCPHSARACNDCLAEAYATAAPGRDRDRAFDRIEERAREEWPEGRMLLGTPIGRIPGLPDDLCSAIDAERLRGTP